MKIFFFVLALILAVVNAGLVQQGAPVVPIKQVITPVVTKPVIVPAVHPSPVTPVIANKHVITPVVTKPGAYQG